MTPVPSTTQVHNSDAQKVVRLPTRESDDELIELLGHDARRAQAGIYDKYSADVERILMRLLGPDSEIADLLHDVFLTAFGSLGGLRERGKLRSWLIGIAVFQTRKLIRRRKLRRIVESVSPFELPEQEACLPSVEVTEALRETYAILSRLPTEERIAFALRCVDGMDLSSVAEVTGVSLATVKRRVGRAQCSFVSLAKESEVLREWVEKGALAQ
jgi:RNA polymerase sigma-70 factor, ECF subfamily